MGRLQEPVDARGFASRSKSMLRPLGSSLDRPGDAKADAPLPPPVFKPAASPAASNPVAQVIGESSGRNYEAVAPTAASTSSSSSVPLFHGGVPSSPMLTRSFSLCARMEEDNFKNNGDDDVDVDEATAAIEEALNEPSRTRTRPHKPKSPLCDPRAHTLPLHESPVSPAEFNLETTAGAKKEALSKEFRPVRDGDATAALPTSSSSGLEARGLEELPTPFAKKPPTFRPRGPPPPPPPRAAAAAAAAAPLASWAAGLSAAATGLPPAAVKPAALILDTFGDEGAAARSLPLPPQTSAAALPPPPSPLLLQRRVAQAPGRFPAASAPRPFGAGGLSKSESESGLAAEMHAWTTSAAVILSRGLSDPQGARVGGAGVSGRDSSGDSLGGALLPTLPRVPRGTAVAQVTPAPQKPLRSGLPALSPPSSAGALRKSTHGRVNTNPVPVAHQKRQAAHSLSLPRNAAEAGKLAARVQGRHLLSLTARFPGAAKAAAARQHHSARRPKSSKLANADSCSGTFI